MTPKEKAKKLIEMFEVNSNQNALRHQKQCALICVERERQAAVLGLLFFHTKVSDERMENVVNYVNQEYKELKQEIEKL